MCVPCVVCVRKCVFTTAQQRALGCHCAAHYSALHARAVSGRAGMEGERGTAAGRRGRLEGGCFVLEVCQSSSVCVRHTCPCAAVRAHRRVHTARPHLLVSPAALARRVCARQTRRQLPRTCPSCLVTCVYTAQDTSFPRSLHFCLAPCAAATTAEQPSRHEDGCPTSTTAGGIHKFRHHLLRAS